MLCLTRYVGQSIVIGDPAKPIAVVKLIRLKGGAARLAIQAAESVPVNRQEIAEQITGKQLIEGGAAHA